MAGWETLLAATGGLVLGAGVAGMWLRRAERLAARSRIELDARVRRVVVPVLERRADVLQIPSAERGSDGDGSLEVALTLAGAIQLVEESEELPYGDTVEVSRDEVSDVRARARSGKQRERA